LSKNKNKRSLKILRIKKRAQQVELLQIYIS
jgi:hypothetical protein